jgi:superfamily II DNA helicase RecQ
MRVKVITLAYDEGLRGFPRDALERVGAEGALLEVRDHFFVHQGVPHLALVLLLDEADTGPRRSGMPDGPDPGAALPEALQPLYRNLRRWRNERAKAEGVPAYALFRNVQLAEICRRLPRSLAALREIEGIGEATCAKYGQEVLSLLAEVPAPPAPTTTPAQKPATPPGGAP